MWLSGDIKEKRVFTHVNKMKKKQQTNCSDYFFFLGHFFSVSKVDTKRFKSDNSN